MRWRVQTMTLPPKIARPNPCSYRPFARPGQRIVEPFFPYESARLNTNNLKWQRRNFRLSLRLFHNAVDQKPVRSGRRWRRINYCDDAAVARDGLEERNSRPGDGRIKAGRTLKQIGV